MVPRKQAGHMTCTRPQAERQILLAMLASSTHDPTAKFDAAQQSYAPRSGEAAKRHFCSGMSGVAIIDVGEGRSCGDGN